MPFDLSIVLEDTPGKLADLGEALGNAGINVRGGCGEAYEGKGYLHILVDDASEAHAVLDAVGVQVTEVREVMLVQVEDRPGTLGSVARNLASAGINIDLIYLSAGDNLVLGVDDLDKAKGVL